LLIDSMICRRGLKNRCPAWGFSPLRAGRSSGDRDAYVREVSAVAAPGARLLIVAFLPGGRFGVRGVEPAEMERRFAPAWTLLSTGNERELDREKTPARHYLFQRRT
jgi:hypothetical protein